MSESPDLNEWKQRWLRAAPELERIQRAELRAMTEEQRLRLLDSLLELAKPQVGQRGMGGLAELYRRLRQHSQSSVIRQREDDALKSAD